MFKFHTSENFYALSNGVGSDNRVGSGDSIDVFFDNKIIMYG
jgi:hypothetical protein